MQHQPLILLVSEQPFALTAIREAIERNAAFRLQVLERVSTATARVAGGGVSLILFDLPANSSGYEGFLQLRDAASEVPVIILSDETTETLALQTVCEGAVASLHKNRFHQDLESALNALVNRLSESRDIPSKPALHERAATMLAFAGAKGGVGSTTAALNVAAMLAHRHRVILAEMTPDLSLLRHYLRPQRAVRGLGPLLASQSAAESSREVEASLWGIKSIPNLRILLGPQAAQECRPINPLGAKTLIKTLSKTADYVVLDLPASLSDASRTLIGDCDLLALAVERDPLCIEYAKSAIQALKVADAIPPDFGAVVVNRSALAWPISLSDIELSLGIPIMGVIPPAADLCISAQKAHSPVVAFDSESLIARSLASLAERLDIRIP